MNSGQQPLMLAALAVDEYDVLAAAFQDPVTVSKWYQDHGIMAISGALAVGRRRTAAVEGEAL
jgi:hypothetical protein